MNPLERLHEAGQSIWLDSIRRAMLDSGKLSRYIDEMAVTGLTSNPSIFEKAISGSTDYDDVIARRHGEAGSTEELFYELALDDLRRAADLFHPVHDSTDGTDGFVSLEVSPDLAYDADGTVREARRLHEAADRDNLLIKVPGTEAGTEAIEELIHDGVPVNVTLLFSAEQYRASAEAYLRGLERRLEDGRTLDVVSVASIFISRWDAGTAERLPEELRNRVGISMARRCHALYREILGSERWRRLEAAGARPQKLLWASTGTKDPELKETYYVEALAAEGTINTIPEETLLAFGRCGDVGELLDAGDAGEAEALLAEMEAAGVDLEQLASRLQTDGADAFAESFEKLMGCIESKVQALEGDARSRLHLGGLQSDVESALEELQEAGAVERIWSRDHTLWQEDPQGVADRLGWLHAPEEMRGQVDRLRSFAREVREDGITHVLWSGMGGSSLFAGVLRDTFGSGADGLDLRVIDSSDPAAVRRATDELPEDATLYCFASKSGTTLETRSHMAHFWKRVERPDRFVAVTDRGTRLDEIAVERDFRAVFRNNPEIGGRYSALSFFGLLPAALLGVDVAVLLDRAGNMKAALSPCVPGPDNPGLQLAAVLGAAVRRGRDKCTLLPDQAIASFGGWLEQLLAESTGKEGTGALPFVEPSPGEVGVYGDDRLFVRLGDGPAVGPLRQAGHPVLELDLADPYDLGAEVLRWEFGVALAGVLLGINAFDQPDVEAAKSAARRALEEGAGDIPTEDPEGLLREAKPGESYVVVQVYADPDAAALEEVSRVATGLRDRLRVATSVQVGPRYLHSTGQLHKGGPPTGIFLQVVTDDDGDVEIPGQRFGFSELKRAQAAGDYRALRERGLPVARVTMDSVLALGR